MLPTKQTKLVNNPQQSPPAVNDFLLKDFQNLIESKFPSLEELIASKITRQHEEDIGMIKVEKSTANTALHLATSNLALIGENTGKLTSHEFDHQSVLERLVGLEIENRKIKEELKDTKNRGMRKTLILFKNIPQKQKCNMGGNASHLNKRNKEKKYKMRILILSAKTLRGYTERRTTNLEIICQSFQNLPTGIFPKR